MQNHARVTLDFSDCHGDLLAYLYEETYGEITGFGAVIRDIGKYISPMTNIALPSSDPSKCGYSIDQPDETVLPGKRQGQSVNQVQS